MNRINEELFIKNYFNKKRKIVMQEDFGISLALGGFLGGIVGLFLWNAFKLKFENSFKKWLEKEEENVNFPSRVDTDERASSKSFEENKMELTDKIDSVLEIPKSIENKLPPKNKDELTKIISIRDNINNALIQIYEAKKKDDIKEIKNQGIELQVNVPKFSEDLIKFLSNKEIIKLFNKEDLSKLNNNLLDLGKYINMNSSELKDSIDKMIKNANLSEDQKNQVSSAFNGLTDDKNEIKYSITDFFENQNIKKANEDEINFKNFFIIQKKGKTLTLNFSIRHYSLSKKKLESILENLKKNFKINKKDTDISNMFEEAEEEKIEIGNKDSEPLQFSLYFQYQKKDDILILKPFSETAKKFEEAIKVKPESSIGKKFREQKFFLDLSDKPGSFLYPTIELNEYKINQPYFQITKKEQVLYINFYFEKKSFTEKQIKDFKDNIKRSILFSNNKNPYNINDDKNLQNFFEEDTKLFYLKDFSAKINIENNGYKISNEDLDKFIPDDLTIFSQQDLPEELFYDLNKPFIIGSELTLKKTTDKYLHFIRNKNSIYKLKIIEFPDNTKLDQILLKTVLAFESQLPLDETKSGEIEIESKNNKYYVKEIIEKAKFPNAPGIKDKIKNFFNDPKNKFTNTDNTLPLFIIGIQKNGKGSIMLQKIAPTLIKAEDNYWLLLRANHIANRSDSPERIFGIKLDKTNEESMEMLIRILKRIAFILSKYDTTKKIDFNNFKLECFNNVYFNPSNLEDENIRLKYLVDFTNLSKFLKVILTIDFYNKIKIQGMTKTQKIPTAQNPINIDCGTFKNTWASSFVPKENPEGKK
jgi:hypothetical protein